jgi:pimeloyl-ACP methyl ester carboxylesterase
LSLVTYYDTTIVLGGQGIYATYYAEKHSEHIEHLLLVSPAGVGEPPFKSEQIATPWKILSSFFITPMSIVRFAGPFGPRLVRFVIEKRISWVPPTNVLRTGAMSLHDVSSYSYHNWALKSSGDRGLHTHLLPVRLLFIIG